MNIKRPREELWEISLVDDDEEAGDQIVTVQQADSRDNSLYLPHLLRQLRRTTTSNRYLALCML